MALFLVSELLDLGCREGDEQFYACEFLKALVEVGLLTVDHVVEVSDDFVKHGTEVLRVLPIKWSRLRRHDFISYAEDPQGWYATLIEKSQGDFSAGVQGAEPLCPKPVAGEACPSQAGTCFSARCEEDGYCRRTGEVLESKT